MHMVMVNKRTYPVGEKGLGRHGQTGHKVQRQRPYGDLHEDDGDIGRNLGDAKRRAVEQAEGLVLGQDGAPLEGFGTLTSDMEVRLLCMCEKKSAPGRHKDTAGVVESATLESSRHRNPCSSMNGRASFSGPYKTSFPPSRSSTLSKDGRCRFRLGRE